MSENKIIENYGCYTFNDSVLKERVSEEIYNLFHQALNNGEPLTNEIAKVRIASGKLNTYSSGAKL